MSSCATRSSTPRIISTGGIGRSRLSSRTSTGSRWADRFCAIGHFFFGSFEGFRQRKAQSAVATTFNQALRQGDFSNFRDAAGQLVTIYDPNTVRQDPSNPTRYIRDPFPRTTSYRRPVFRRWRGIFSATSTRRTCPTARPFGAGLYLNNDSRRQDQEQFSIRVDHQLMSNNNFFARYSLTDEQAEVPGSWSATGDLRAARGQILTLNDTHVFGPQAVNEVKLGFTRLRNNILSKNAFQTNIPYEVGIQDQANLKPIDWGVPSVDVLGYTTIGDRNFGLPTQTRNNSYQFADNLSLQLGRHGLKIGVEAIRYQLNNLTDNFYLPSFTFRGVPFTAGVATDATSGGSLFADFLLGHPNLTQRSDGDSLIYLRRWGVSPYIQDDWKISNRLTLNLGLRYDLLTPWVEKDDRFGGLLVENIVGAPAPKPVQAGVGVPRGIIYTDKNNFAPRLGIAYRPFGDNRMAVRAGYGVFYDTQIGNTTVDFVRNPPFQVRLIADSPDNVTPQLVLTRLIPENFTVSSSYFGQRQAFPLAYIQHWNLSVQRELGSNLSLDAGYVGTTGRKLSSSLALNLPVPGPGAFGPRRPFTPFGIDSIFQYALPYVNSFYHSLQLKLERRFTEGFSILGAYTFSKSIDDGQEIRGGGTSQQQLNNWDLVGENRGRSNFDMRHRFVTSYLWELPVRPRKTVRRGLAGRGRPSDRRVVDLRHRDPFDRIPAHRVQRGRQRQHGGGVPGASEPDRRARAAAFGTGSVALVQYGGVRDSTAVRFRHSGRNTVEAAGCRKRRFRLDQEHGHHRETAAAVPGRVLQSIEHAAFRPPGQPHDVGELRPRDLGGRRAGHPVRVEISVLVPN